MQLARDLLRKTTREAAITRMKEESALFTERLSSPEARAAFEAFMARKKKA